MSSFTSTLEAWNRKLHFYLGLYFLLFLWLFSLTGLLLNHGQWRVSTLANARQESQYERAIQPLMGTTDLERARDVMRQLDIRGEIDLPAQRPGSLTFNTARPGDAHQVRVDMSQNRVVVRRFDNALVGRFRILHTFSGSRYNQPESRRDWVLTTLWVIAMDALAVGLLAMVLGSYYMWWRRKPRRTPGLLVLGAGITLALWFISGFGV